MADERSRARAYLRAQAARLKAEMEAVTEALNALESPMIRGGERRSLADKQVREIRAEAARAIAAGSKPNITELARKYNVSRHTMADVVTGKRYKGVK